MKVGFQHFIVEVHVHVDFALKEEAVIINVKHSQALVLSTSVDTKDHDSANVYILEHLAAEVKIPVVLEEPCIGIC